MSFKTKAIFCLRLLPYFIILALIIYFSGLYSKSELEMNNFDFILNDFPAYIYNNPTLFALIPLIIGALLYYFGSIIIANNWQYNNSPKAMIYFRGAMFLYGFVLYPIFILVIIIYLIGKLNVNLGAYNINPFIIVFLILIFSELIFKSNQFFYNKIKTANRNILDKIIHYDINSWLVIKIIFYGLNYLFLITTKGKIAILFLVVIDFMILSGWANLFEMRAQELIGEITLKNNKQTKGRLIEQINDGTILKVQTGEHFVEYIPINNIEKIMIQEPLPENLILDGIHYLLDKIFNSKK